jgi:hypothetical protein
MVGGTCAKLDMMGGLLAAFTWLDITIPFYVGYEYHLRVRLWHVLTYV